MIMLARDELTQLRVIEQGAPEAPEEVLALANLTEPDELVQNEPHPPAPNVANKPVRRERYRPRNGNHKKSNPVGVHRSCRRKSSKRDIVFQVLDNAGRPLSPQEILNAAQEEAPTLGIATVYRNIRQLQDDGMIEAVELPGSAVRYELAGKHHHHHFHCNSCGRVYEIEGCPFAENPQDNMPAGFEVEDHAVVVYGRCADCSRR